MEHARCALVSAQKFGKTLVIMCENSAPDFARTFRDEGDWNLDGRSYFPVQTFQAAGKVVARKWPDLIWRHGEKELGYALAKEGFQVIVTSSFKPELLDEYLWSGGGGLPSPKAMYKALLVLPENAPQEQVSTHPLFTGAEEITMTGGSTDIYHKYEGYFVDKEEWKRNQC